jgi:hypothetical protein
MGGAARRNSAILHTTVVFSDFAVIKSATLAADAKYRGIHYLGGFES